MDDGRSERLARLFKALADPARLRILGALAEEPRTGRELSDRIGLTPPTISHHMARLVAAGLVRIGVDGDRRAYLLDNGLLRELSREEAGREANGPDVPPRTADHGGDGEVRAKVIRDFFAGERLKQIPAQRKKRVPVLQHLMRRFVPGRDYPEREVNDLLRPAHDDVATLRRELVDYGFMTRQNGVYRVAETPPARGPTVAQEIVGDEHAWLRDLVGQATARALNGDDRGGASPS
jgi:DNA-binding transcriptional ArsR family regulator